MWFIVFIASMISSVCPWVTRAPISMNVAAPGSGDHGRLHASRVIDDVGTGAGRLGRRARHGGRAGNATGTSSRGSRCDRRHGDLASHPELEAVALDFDFG
jgi:hypothetical protein